MQIRVLCIVLASSVLTACGGGGGGGGGESSSSTPLPPPVSVLTGQFVDSPVAGLFYRTPTRAGLTDAQGNFKYLAGETIVFSLGGTTLGQAKGSAVVTPFSLTGMTPVRAELEILDLLKAASVNSFDRTLNIATFLQSLDTDGNPDNGIDLGNAHQKLLNTTVDLSVKAPQFTQQAAYTAARSQVGVSHSQTYLRAADHIYRSLGIGIESQQVSSFSSQVNKQNNGSLSYTYDASGRVTKESTDRNGDGIADSEKTYTYDSQGRLSQITDSATNITEQLSYDGQGNILTRSIRSSSAGQLMQEAYSYAGNRLSNLAVTRGTEVSRTRYDYASNGKIASFLQDVDGDGIDDTRSSYTYSGDLPSVYTQDTNNDGTPDVVTTYSYDAQGNRRSVDIVSTAPDVSSQIGYFTYDAQKNLTRYEQDLHRDGRIDLIEDYRYNARNQRTRYRRDVNADGQWDFIAQYTYDANGNRTKMVEDSDGNGIADKVWEASYQSASLQDAWGALGSKL